MTDTASRVHKILVDHLGIEAAVASQPEAMIVDDLGADSLDVLELIMAVEDEFGIKIPDDDADEVRTVGELIALVEVFLAAPATPAG